MTREHNLLDEKLTQKLRLSFLQPAAGEIDVLLGESLDDLLAGPGQLAVAAALGRQIDDDDKYWT